MVPSLDLPTGHVCWVVDAAADPVERVATWARNGLAAGERVVAVLAPERYDALRQRLRDEGVDVDTAAAQGRLLLLAPADVYLVDGAFDIERRMALHAAFVEQSVAEGFSAVRLASEASMALDVAGDTDALLAYERRVEALCRSLPISGVCFYDRTVFGPALPAFVAAHPDGAADAQLSGASAPGRVRLRGDVDLSNLDLLEALLTGAVTDEGDLVVDLHDLSFIDLSGAAVLVAVSRRLGPQQRVKVLSPPRLLFTMFDALGWSENLDLVLGEVA